MVSRLLPSFLPFFPYRFSSSCISLPTLLSKDRYRNKTSAMAFSISAVPQACFYSYRSAHLSWSLQLWRLFPNTLLINSVVPIRSSAWLVLVLLLFEGKESREGGWDREESQSWVASCLCAPSKEERGTVLTQTLEDEGADWKILSQVERKGEVN